MVSELEAGHIGNVLFIIEVMKYKSVLIEKIGLQYVENGFVLPFEYNDHLPTPWIVQNLLTKIKQNDGNMNNDKDLIKLDLMTTYNRYIVKDAVMKTSFLSGENKNVIMENLEKSEEIKDMMSIFDKGIIEINGKLQLLFVEFRIK